MPRFHPGVYYIVDLLPICKHSTIAKVKAINGSIHCITVGRCFRMGGLYHVGEDASTDVRHYLWSSFAGDDWLLLVATQRA